MHTIIFITALLLDPLAVLHPADVPQSPLQVWADYDPNKGDFKEEIISGTGVRVQYPTNCPHRGVNGEDSNHTRLRSSAGMQCCPGCDAGRPIASNSYYEIAINPAGTVLEIDHGKDGKGVKWTSGAQFAAHRGDKQLSIEMRLPITGEGSSIIDPIKGIDGAMPKDLFPWHFNLCRQRVCGTTIVRTAFSATGKDDFYVPEKFAKLWGKRK